ncbi:MAG TPA: hypothetical protein PLS50_02195 [Candidatus Dojkabacteria bacterium]|nr:hypothetical protein [Candidatus Dojkabacteria bacterium]
MRALKEPKTERASKKALEEAFREEENKIGTDFNLAKVENKKKNKTETSIQLNDDRKKIDSEKEEKMGGEIEDDNETERGKKRERRERRGERREK